VDEYDAWDQSFFKPDVAAPEFVGMNLVEAGSQPSAVAAEILRVADLDGPRLPVLTLDYRPRRLTFLVRSGLVVRAGWF
jgi:hypothetical protein